jgi:hypothetical protein
VRARPRPCVSSMGRPHRLTGLDAEQLHVRVPA